MSGTTYLSVVEVLAFQEVLIEEAAALLESLVQTHPFVDGNKRVAVAVMDVFLRVNGLVLEVTDREAHAFLVGLLERHARDLAAVDAWLRPRMR